MSERALRTVVHPTYGIFVVREAEVGFEATPLDPHVTSRWGVVGFTGETVTDLVEGMHNW
jgi:hypothetical protein